MIQRRTHIVGIAALLGAMAVLFSTAGAQSVNPEKLMRGKYWIKCLPNGALDRETTVGFNAWESLYPGDYNAQNESAGGWDNTVTYNGAMVAGTPVGWFYRSVQYNSPNVYAITQTAVTRNHNLVNPARAEEYLTGTIGSYQYDGSGARHMKYSLTGTVRVWSQPKYDDFVIMECTLTNTDDTTFNDFYYARLVTPNGPYRPASVSVGWDKEYEWDPALGDTLGFIFYDDTSLPPTSTAPIYTIPPGDSTGNAGDPGNIGIQGSKNYKLYSPFVYAYTFVLDSLPLNKFGQRKIWRKIVSTDSRAEPLELLPSRYDALAQYGTLVNFLTTNEQPRMSWRAADSASVPGAGSKWERNPRYMYGIGPFDIPPGGSIHWYEVFVAGQMDRNVSLLGGYEATRRFKAEGIANLKDNFAAARSLIRSRFQLPFRTIPPPTPAETPRTADGSFAPYELKAVPWAIDKDSARIQGVRLTWKAVHVGYRDPQTLRTDFGAYKVYRSNATVEGPWTLIDSVHYTKADSLVLADSMVIGSDINYFIQSPPNVPYRYCVTSIDTLGNESAMTGYTFYPVAAEPAPSNNQNEVRVVPNPFRQVSGFPDQAENKRLAFVNIPSICTIRIYTLALDLVKTLEHRSGGGIETWGSQSGKDYMLTDFAQNVQPGIYVYHIESHVPGHEGETSIGKFAIIK